MGWSTAARSAAARARKLKPGSRRPKPAQSLFPSRKKGATPAHPSVALAARSLPHEEPEALRKHHVIAGKKIKAGDYANTHGVLDKLPKGTAVYGHSLKHGTMVRGRHGGFSSSGNPFAILHNGEQAILQRKAVRLDHPHLNKDPVPRGRKPIPRRKAKH